MTLDDESWVDMARRQEEADREQRHALATMLDCLPVAKRGPKANVLRCSLVEHNLPSDACWPWQGRIARGGYGIAVRPGQRTKGTSAHRVVWELIHGPAPAGSQIDHICHDPARCVGGDECSHRRCVNPRHLSLTTARANTLRSNSPAATNAAKTHCIHGHEFTPDNTYTYPSGSRLCRACQRTRQRSSDLLREARA